MSVFLWMDEELQWFHIYVDGQYICDVQASSEPYAVLQARREKAVQDVLKGKTNQCYKITAKVKASGTPVVGV
jgi:hypothetical protein